MLQPQKNKSTRTNLSHAVDGIGWKKPAMEKDESWTERTDTQAPLAYR